MVDEQDGGRWALAGFLYQIVGMLSITAHVSKLTREQEASGIDDVNVLIDLDLTGVDPDLLAAQHERFGEDALFQAGDRNVLVQFKYTAAPTPNKIDQGELKGIIERWDRHVKRARSQEKDVTACALVTNREFTSRGGGAQQLWEDERQTRDYELRKLPGYSLQNGIEDLEAFAREYGAIARALLRTTGKPF